MTTRILIVDDNAINLKLVSDILECEGYNIDRAIDAKSALAVIKNQQPDLILMDIGLPDIDGLTLTKQLKAAPATSDISIIALTAFAMKGDEQKALEAGCNGYITKPIDTRKFPVQIAEILQQTPKKGIAEQ